jgi:GNAT superfamily N-acetyltransferase
MTESRLNGVTIRAATEQDTATLLRLIRAQAAYEGQSDACTVTEGGLRRGLFGARPIAEAIIAEQAGAAIGFALFFEYFSPFPGVPGMFVELLYVEEAWRGQGVGRALLGHVARIAVARGCGRLEWGVHNQNTPAIGFYGRLGATFVDDTVACRLEGDALRWLAASETG